MRRWRREHRLLDARDLRTVGGHVAVLPAPRRRRRSRLAWLLVITLAAIAILGLLLVFGGVPVDAALAVGSSSRFGLQQGTDDARPRLIDAGPLGGDACPALRRRGDSLEDP